MKSMSKQCDIVRDILPLYVDGACSCLLYTSKYGFVTVNYTSNAKLKVGIQYGSEKVSYKNCPSGKDAVFSLEQGDGTYTISLCENISGTTYRVCLLYTSRCV